MNKGSSLGIEAHNIYIGIKKLQSGKYELYSEDKTRPLKAVDHYGIFYSKGQAMTLLVKLTKFILGDEFRKSSIPDDWIKEMQRED